MSVKTASYALRLSSLTIAKIGISASVGHYAVHYAPLCTRQYTAHHCPAHLLLCLGPLSQLKVKKAFSNNHRTFTFSQQMLWHFYLLLSLEQFDLQ